MNDGFVKYIKSTINVISEVKDKNFRTIGIDESMPHYGWT